LKLNKGKKMTQEILKHKEITNKFCPIINNKCLGAYCMSFKAEDVSRKSTANHNEGDWEPIPLHERSGSCMNPNIYITEKDRL